MRSFHSEKIYQCTECDKAFCRPDKLRLHMLRHSDRKDFLCSTCGKQFKVRWLLAASLPVQKPRFPTLLQRDKLMFSKVKANNTCKHAILACELHVLLGVLCELWHPFLKDKGQGHLCILFQTDLIPNNLIAKELSVCSLRTETSYTSIASCWGYIAYISSVKKLLGDATGLMIFLAKMPVSMASIF